MQASVSDKSVTKFGSLLYHAPLLFPRHYIILEMALLAENNGVDVHPGLFFRYLPKHMRGSWQYADFKQSIVRGFKECLNKEFLTPWISVTKRGQKRQLYKLTKRGKHHLADLPLHLPHYRAECEDKTELWLRKTQSFLIQPTQKSRNE